jgi:hypothetical protein
VHELFSRKKWMRGTRAALAFIGAATVEESGGGVRLGGSAARLAALGRPNMNSLIFDLFKPF